MYGGDNNSVDNWNIKDLLEIFGEPDKLSTLDKKSDELISKAIKQGKGALADFLGQGADKLRREHFDETMGDPSFNDGLTGQAKELVTEQNPKMGNFGRQRGHAYRVLEGAGMPRVVPNKLRIDQRTEYNSKYQQGYVNPNFVQSYTRTIVLNSAFRPNAIPYIAGDVYGPSSSTSYHATLSEPLRMTTSLKLQSVSIPRVWDNISCALGNSVIGVVLVSNAGDKLSLAGEVDWFYVEDGYYSEISNTIKLTAFHGTRGTLSLDAASSISDDSSETSPSISVSSSGVFISGTEFGETEANPNAKVTLTYTPDLNIPADNSEYRLVFYSPNMPTCNADIGKCYATSSSSRNLASTLGFAAVDVIQDVNKNPLVISVPLETAPDGNTYAILAPSPPDLISIRYFIIALDDFNVNKATNALVGIADPNNKIQPTKSTFMNGPANGPCQFVQTVPRSQTQKQIFAQNSKLDSTLKPETASVNPSIANMISLCPVTAGSFGSIMTLTGTGVNSTKRTYFGPVKLEKVKITLYDEAGRIVDLKGQDWSVTLTAEQLYQY